MAHIKPRKLIICSDGTGNSGSKARGTNVWRFYKALDLDPQYQQITFYQDGVGSQDAKLLRILGGAFGYGLNANIREMYSFLVANYQPGDEIYLLGFSRGAFTVRAFACLLLVCGIIKPSSDPAETEQHISEAIKHYHKWRAGIRSKNSAGINNKSNKANHPIKLQQIVDNFRHLHKHSLDELLSEADVTKHIKIEGEGDTHFPMIKFIGVWETVDAIGLPIDELTDALDWLFKFRFYSYDRFPIAVHNYHALAIDDARLSFHPVMWDEQLKVYDQKVEQVWFAGMHSNVGGGYKKDEMAYVALDWMMQKAENLGTDSSLKFLPYLREEAATQANANGKIYDSRSGLAIYYRYKPRNIKEICQNSNVPVTIDNSVFNRIAHSTEDYAPVTLPKHYNTGKASHIDQYPDKRLEAQKVADEVIWWRRINYFLILVSSIILIFVARRLSNMPLPPSGDSTSLVDRFLNSIADYLPDFLGRWIVAFSGRPGVLFFFIALFTVLFIFRRYLKKRTNYLGKLAWNLSTGIAKNIPQKTILESYSHWIKSFYLPQSTRDFGRKKLFPFITLVFVAGLLLLWIANTLTLPKKPSVCKNSISEFKPIDENSTRVINDFHSCNPWFASGIRVKKGETYSIEVKEKEPWFDDTIPASPDGLKQTPAFLQKFAPFPRRNGKEKKSSPQGWFALLANVNGKQQETVGSSSSFTAKYSGPLYFYVNDSICDVCFFKGVFAYYRNNHGTAEIRVKKRSDVKL